MENEQDLADETARWWGHPAALSAMKAFQSKADSAMQELKNACASSADPKVSAAFARFTAYSEHVAFYVTGRKRSGA